MGAKRSELRLVRWRVRCCKCNTRTITSDFQDFACFSIIIQNIHSRVIQKFVSQQYEFVFKIHSRLLLFFFHVKSYVLQIFYRKQKIVLNRYFLGAREISVCRFYLYIKIKYKMSVFLADRPLLIGTPQHTHFLFSFQTE